MFGPQRKSSKIPCAFICTACAVNSNRIHIISVSEFEGLASIEPMTEVFDAVCRKAQAKHSMPMHDFLLETWGSKVDDGSRQRLGSAYDRVATELLASFRISRTEPQ